MGFYCTAQVLVGEYSHTACLWRRVDSSLFVISIDSLHHMTRYKSTMPPITKACNQRAVRKRLAWALAHQRQLGELFYAPLIGGKARRRSQQRPQCMQGSR
jgi:hypothetical protein